MVVVGFGLNTATLPRGLTNRHLYFNDSGDTSDLAIKSLIQGRNGLIFGGSTANDVGFE
jgi:hypothetical protein